MPAAHSCFDLVFFFFSFVFAGSRVLTRVFHELFPSYQAFIEDAGAAAANDDEEEVRRFEALGERTKAILVLCANLVCAYVRENLENQLEVWP